MIFQALHRLASKNAPIASGARDYTFRIRIRLPRRMPQPGPPGWVFRITMDWKPALFQDHLVLDNTVPHTAAHSGVPWKNDGSMTVSVIIIENLLTCLIVVPLAVEVLAKGPRMWYYRFAAVIGLGGDVIASAVFGSVGSAVCLDLMGLILIVWAYWSSFFCQHCGEPVDRDVDPCPHCEISRRSRD